MGEHEIPWRVQEGISTLHDHLQPLPGPPGKSDISALVTLIESNCLLQVALKPFQSPLKLGNIDNTTPWGFNLSSQEG